ncbi:hypothetical protein [Rhodospirillaceae bacterium SYSU D60014]|uniref:hypothetical protein n=1 Tax=Virgifigura deserti TaxID=2268457 RepID=UPI000E66DBF1
MEGDGDGAAALERGRLAATAATLDRIDVGIILVDAGLRVQAVNRMAEAILRANDGLHLRNGRLSVSVPAKDRVLEALVRRTILTAQG